jgi:hypothetical protein
VRQAFGFEGSPLEIDRLRERELGVGDAPRSV